jgi:hypothetical protein
MRVQIMHQTVYEIGQPRQTAIILNDDEVDMLHYIALHCVFLVNLRITDFATELAAQINNAIDISQHEENI